MNLPADLNKPLFSLTVGEFLELQKQAEKPVIIDTVKNGKEFAYGLKGIAELFGCSITTAGDIKRSGKIDKAISQTGRTIIVDKELALSLIKKKK